MNARLIATTLAIAGVLGAGAGMASYYVGRDPGSSERGTVPLFLTSAQQSDSQPLWPPRSEAVAFNNEMITLLTLGATMSGAAQQAMAQDTIEPQPPKPMTRRERRRLQQEERAQQRAERAYGARAQSRDSRGRVEGDDVEVRVWDRNGRHLQTRRVEREMEMERPRAYAPGPARRFGPFGNW
jgi:hypothetical protein